MRSAALKRSGSVCPNGVARAASTAAATSTGTPAKPDISSAVKQRAAPKSLKGRNLVGEFARWFERASIDERRGLHLAGARRASDEERRDDFDDVRGSRILALYILVRLPQCPLRAGELPKHVDRIVR